ncbi:MAG: PHP-associated domain-containing protein [Anaerolineales bacterium]
MKVDCHVHTVYSPDSLSSLVQIERVAQRRGIDVLAITDHNSIRGALLLARWSTLQIIVGEEILTTQGELIGLFLSEEIPAGLSPLDTARAIQAQGGLVCIPHPCDQARRSSALTSRGRDEVLAWVDMIEVFNARTTHRVDLSAAEELAARHGLLRSAGSDAHSAAEIGRAYVDMPAFVDAASFREALAVGSIWGRLSSPFVHVSSTAARLSKSLTAVPQAAAQRDRDYGQL